MMAMRPLAGRQRTICVGQALGRGRSLCGGSSKKRSESLFERNDRLREASETKLSESRQRLMDDVATRQQDMTSLREVIREKSVTLHAAPNSLYSQKTAFRFPEMQAESLAGDTVSLSTRGGGFFDGKWTVLGCTGSNFAAPMVDGWLTSIGESSAATATDGPESPSSAAMIPNVQVRWLSFVEGMLLSWFRRPLLVSMRRSVPSDRHESFLCHFGDSDAARKVLLMQNRYLGYVCVVDPQGVVRWHVHGNEVPGAKDLATLNGILRSTTR